MSLTRYSYEVIMTAGGTVDAASVADAETDAVQEAIDDVVFASPRVVYDVTVAETEAVNG